MFRFIKRQSKERERDMIGVKSLAKPTQIRNANDGSEVNDDAH